MPDDNDFGISKLVVNSIEFFQYTFNLGHEFVTRRWSFTFSDIWGVAEMRVAEDGEPRSRILLVNCTEKWCIEL